MPNPNERFNPFLTKKERKFVRKGVKPFIGLGTNLVYPDYTYEIHEREFVPRYAPFYRKERKKERKISTPFYRKVPRFMGTNRKKNEFPSCSLGKNYASALST